MKSTLRDLSYNAVKDLDPALIDDDGPRDRLAISDADVAELSESIRLHGQQVPIMVRPLPDAPGRYRIVYGRRRLRALKLAGLPAKALVRTLTGEQAIVAQGQENSLHLDPSFIEKAVFVNELADAGYEPTIILDALAIDKPMLSRMTKVARTIPAEVIRFVGAAHGVGRRRWEEMADAARNHSVDLTMLSNSLGAGIAEMPSDDRFARLQEAVTREITEAPTGPGGRPALPVTDNSGLKIVEVKSTARAVTIRIAKDESPGFMEWMRENAEFEILRLYEAWKSENPSD